MDEYPESQIMKFSTTLPAQSPQESQVDQMNKLVALSKLQSFYYQPGQTKPQIEGMLEDMLSDLKAFTVVDVERACVKYRMKGENRFFPTSGQLMASLQEKPEPAPRSNLKHYDAAEFQHDKAVPPGQLKAPYLILMENRGMSFDAAMAAQRRMFPKAFPSGSLTNGGNK